jgi:ABC-type uncharacterized transport system substrate-binding protein
MCRFFTCFARWPDYLLRRERVLFFLLSAFCGMLHAQAEDLPLPPEGKVFRVAYLDSGAYWSADSLFGKIRARLKAAGWGKAVVFPQDLHVSLNWGKNPEAEKALVAALLTRKDVDLVLSFGTIANQTILALNSDIPVIGVGMTNPVAANIVKSKTDSGRDNYTAAVNSVPDSFMFLALQQIVNFKKLGILYSDDPVGRIYAFLDGAREVARESGFELLEYGKLSTQDTVEECLAGVKDLRARGAEVIFLGGLFCIDLQQNDPAPIYAYLDEHHIPSFVADDRDQVRRFATFGIINFSEDDVAVMHARQMIHIFSGTKPRDLPMMAPFNFQLLINLESATHNRVDLPLETLMYADEIYLERLRTPTTVSGERKP